MMQQGKKTVFQIIEDNQLRRDLIFMSRPIEYYLKFYESIMSVMPSFGVAVMIFPSSVDIEHTLDLFANTTLRDSIASLHGNLVPTKSKQVVFDIASGKKKILFTTPEHFYFWFRFAIDNTQDISFDDRLLQALIDILNRIQVISIHSAQIASPENTTHKEKFRRFLERVSKLNKRFMLFYDQYNPGLEEYLQGLFYDVEVHKYELSTPDIGLYTDYSMNDKVKFQRLAHTLSSHPEPTIIYVSDLNNAKMSDLSTYLARQGIEHQIYHEFLPPEVKSETLEAYLKIESPCMLVSHTAKTLPHRSNIRRIIFYGLPESMHHVYREVMAFGNVITNVHLLASETDFQALQRKSLMPIITPAHQSPTNQQTINYKKIKQEFFDFICQTDLCLWDKIEEIFSNVHYGSSCKNCTNCIPEKKKSSILVNISKWVTKSRLRI